MGKDTETAEKRWQDMGSLELELYIENVERQFKQSEVVRNHRDRMRHLRAVLRALMAEGK